jgi:FkbM family methyltransferase
MGRALFEWAYDAYKFRVEAKAVDQLRPWVRPGSHAIDVGANVGFFVRRFADWVGDTGHVIAIEPESANVIRLRKTLARENIEARVDVVCGVAAEEDGELMLKVNPDHPGDHRIGHDGISVKAVSLDSLAAAKGWPDVSFIKIDVQGAELRVLNGATALLERCKPAMFVEVDPEALAEQGASLDQLYGLIVGAGYDIGVLDNLGNHQPVQINDVLRMTAENGGYIDVLCLPKLAPAGST